MREKRELVKQSADPSPASCFIHHVISLLLTKLALLFSVPDGKPITKQVLARPMDSEVDQYLPVVDTERLRQWRRGGRYCESRRDYCYS